jgi:hypothetical protein
MLTPVTAAGWPELAGVQLPPPVLQTYRLDFGPEWSRGNVTNEPPIVGKPYVALVPAVDKDGNGRAGIRLPEVETPLGMYTGWNYRAPSIGDPSDFAGESGSFFPFPPAKVAERYATRSDFAGRIALAAKGLVTERLLFPQDIPGMLDHALLYYDWVMGHTRKPK